MEIEYSNEVKGKVFAFRLEPWEQKAIAKALFPVIKKKQKKITDIYNNPLNEGQATYQTKIEEIEREIKELKKIIGTFSN